MVEIRLHPPAAWALLSKHKTHGLVWSQTCVAGGEQDGVAPVSPPISPWRKEWASVASRVHSAGGNLFWELFAGVAILSRTFKREGWRTGPPFDIVYTKAFNLMDPGFFMAVLGLILEGWVSVLHLGPPSSSFSMAINRRASKRIRADERPAGRDNLSDKVRIGNVLAQVAVTLTKAQMKGVRWFRLEQRASSLMLHIPLLKELAVRCICVNGASGVKPTAIIANSRHILDLKVACPACASHIPLQGKSPGGQLWTAGAFCSGFPGSSLLVGLTLGLPALGWFGKVPNM